MIAGVEFTVLPSMKLLPYDTIDAPPAVFAAVPLPVIVELPTRIVAVPPLAFNPKLVLYVTAERFTMTWAVLAPETSLIPVVFCVATLSSTLMLIAAAPSVPFAR
jgi:hypothetical protein